MGIVDYHFLWFEVEVIFGVKGSLEDMGGVRSFGGKRGFIARWCEGRRSGSRGGVYRASCKGWTRKWHGERAK